MTRIVAALILDPLESQSPPGDVTAGVGPGRTGGQF
jgi:hypothetical protein